MTPIGFINTAQSAVLPAAYQSVTKEKQGIKDGLYDDKTRNTFITKDIIAEK